MSDEERIRLLLVDCREIEGSIMERFVAEVDLGEDTFVMCEHLGNSPIM